MSYTEETPFSANTRSFQLKMPSKTVKTLALLHKLLNTNSYNKILTWNLIDIKLSTTVARDVPGGYRRVISKTVSKKYYQFKRWR